MLEASELDTLENIHRELCNISEMICDDEIPTAMLQLGKVIMHARVRLEVIKQDLNEDEDA